MSTQLARPEIQALKAYQSARSLTKGLDLSGKIFLDANEAPLSPLLPYPELNRYPEPQPKELVERLAQIYQVPTNQLMVGRGSDEAIDLIVRVFCSAGKDEIVICPPTYGMYEISANIQGAKTVRIPMVFGTEGPVLNEKNILKVLDQTHAPKLIFICSPNNPTGTLFSAEQLSRICAAAVNKSIVVVDEAYAEFSEAESMIQKISDFPNLIVLRTLSKAWAIAGARCGVALAQAPIIDLLHKVRAPYPMSGPTVDVILKATDESRQALLKTRLILMKSEREKMVSALGKIPSVQFIFPSATNFLLVQFANHDEVIERSREAGIILRDRATESGLKDCIRITLGTPQENQKVLELITRGNLT